MFDDTKNILKKGKNRRKKNKIRNPKKKQTVKESDEKFTQVTIRMLHQNRENSKHDDFWTLKTRGKVLIYMPFQNTECRSHCKADMFN